MASQDLHVYLKSNAVTPIVHAVQNDTGRSIVMHFMDEDLAGASAPRLYFVRSDHSHYNVTATINTTANTCTANITQALTRPGKTHCQIQITQSSGSTTSHVFIIDVEPSANTVPVAQLGYTIDDLKSMADTIAASTAEAKGYAEEAKELVNRLSNAFVYAGYLPNNSDLNDLSGYKFYHLSSDRTYKNSPGNGGILVHEDVSSSNARQVVIKEGLLLYRRKVSNVWHEWNDVIGTSDAFTGLQYDAFTYEGYLTNGMDLNDLVGHGFYQLAGDRTYTNSPVSATDGVLFHETLNSVIQARQILITENAVYFRRLINGNWYDWSDVIGSSEAVRKALLNSSGQPVPVYLASQMNDRSKTYLYVGNESGYEYGHWYYYSVLRLMWVDSGQYGIGVGGNYQDLLNLPSINSITLTGNKTGADLGLVSAESFSILEKRVESEIEAIHAFYQATGGGEEIPLTSGKITQIPLDPTNVTYFGESFEVEDGGIKVSEKGLYKISGSVYLHTDASATRHGCYILAGTSFDTAGEVVSTYLSTGCVSEYGAIGTTMKVVSLNAGDIIYLAARQTKGTESVIYSDNASTFLFVEKMGAGFSTGSNGQPTVVKLANSMIDPNRIYVYVGNEDGYTYGHWYYYDVDRDEWIDSGLYGKSVIDTNYDGSTVTIS